MNRRSLLIALAVSPAMGLADSFSTRGAGDKRRMRELNQQFVEQKNALQEQPKEKKDTEKENADTADRKKPAN
jgi:hypothetical protein